MATSAISITGLTGPASRVATPAKLDVRPMWLSTHAARDHCPTARPSISSSPLQRARIDRRASAPPQLYCAPPGRGAPSSTASASGGAGATGGSTTSAAKGTRTRTTSRSTTGSGRPHLRQRRLRVRQIAEGRARQVVQPEGHGVPPGPRAGVGAPATRARCRRRTATASRTATTTRARTWAMAAAPERWRWPTAAPKRCPREAVPPVGRPRGVLLDGSRRCGLCTRMREVFGVKCDGADCACDDIGGSCWLAGQAGAKHRDPDTLEPAVLPGVGMPPLVGHSEQLQRVQWQRTGTFAAGAQLVRMRPRLAHSDARDALAAGGRGGGVAGHFQERLWRAIFLSSLGGQCEPAAGTTIRGRPSSRGSSSPPPWTRATARPGSGRRSRSGPTPSPSEYDVGSAPLAQRSVGHERSSRRRARRAAAVPFTW